MELARRESDAIGPIQQMLHGVAERAVNLNTRPFETDESTRLHPDLVGPLCEVARDAVSVLDRTLELYDGSTNSLNTAEPGSVADDPSGVFNLAFEELVGEAPSIPPRQRVADVAFMARWELARKLNALSNLGDRTDKWLVLSECCSTRRRVVKALSGVERVLCEAESTTSAFGDLYQTELERAVRTRSAYYRFVVNVRDAGQANDANEVTRVVRLAAIGIAQLVGNDAYEALRVQDRREIRLLQQRLIAWMRNDSDILAGRRLVSDLHAFANLLMKVNQRAHLLEYDRDVLTKLRVALSIPGTDRPALFRLLKTVRGRDRKLDALINRYAELDPQTWGPPVERVLSVLNDAIRH